MSLIVATLHRGGAGSAVRSSSLTWFRRLSRDLPGWSGAECRDGHLVGAAGVGVRLAAAAGARPVRARALSTARSSSVTTTDRGSLLPNGSPTGAAEEAL